MSSIEQTLWMETTSTKTPSVNSLCSKLPTKKNGDFDTPVNDDNFGSWYFIFVLARWSSLSNSSLFLMFEDVNKTDGNFNTADNDNGNDAKKVHRGSRQHCRWGRNQRTCFGQQRTDSRGHFSIFFWVVNANLPTIAFLMGGLLVFAMVTINDKVLFIEPR